MGQATLTNKSTSLVRNLSNEECSSKSSRIKSLGQGIEFFAGIGLVRMALEQCGWEVQFANDISKSKRKMYEENFRSGHFDSRDIREITGGEIPTAEMATASFPCIDLSLAGRHRGLNGSHSGLLWEFLRIIQEMKKRRPKFMVIENVPNFLGSKQGLDLRSAISSINDLGYNCDLVIADARWHVPQSRRRLFIICWKKSLGLLGIDQGPSIMRPEALSKFIRNNTDLDISTLPIPAPKVCDVDIGNVVERLDANDERWWEKDRFNKFTIELSGKNYQKLSNLKRGTDKRWATAYRRTRRGSSAWEIRSDRIAGCLRTASGGSSKQAIVEANDSNAKARWLTPVEYARLQGAETYTIPVDVSNNQALFGFGDAVCVPTVKWVVEVTVNKILQGAYE